MIQHNHKDRLFRMIFGREENKRWTLSLYNANNTSHESNIEVTVLMLNINQGKNAELLAACKVLNDFSWFVDKIRFYNNSMDVSAAVDKAVKMLDEGSEIKPFLLKHMEEVTAMCLTEYNEEATLKMIGEENYQEGLIDGKKAGIEEGIEKSESRYSALIMKLFTSGELDKIEKVATDPQYRNMLFEKYGL